MNFGETIKTARKIKQYNQKELGRLLGLGQTTIANYESNQRFPNKEILIKMSEVLNISLDNLLYYDTYSSLEAFTTKELSELKEDIHRYLLEEKYGDIYDTVMALKLDHARKIQLYEQIFVPILVEVGSLWEKGSISIAKEHFISNMIFQLILTISSSTNRLIKPPTSDKSEGKKVAICLAVSGEQHIIGLRIAVDYFSELGFEPLYLGNNVPTQALIEMAIETGAKVIALSVTLPEHQDTIKNSIEVVRSKLQLACEQHLLGKVPLILIGGQGIVNPHDAVKLGADAYAATYAELTRILDERSLL